jgi:DNA invertase Pin-like site-specific DNA recombinase
MAGEIVFYCRVSTKDQRLDAQVDAARRLGVADANIFVEKASGARHDRPELARAVAACEKGDTFACTKLDRVGRSLVHLTKVLADLDERGVHFQTTEDGLNTKGSTGRLVLHIIGAIAEFERNLILERTMAGLRSAWAQGVKSGRRRLMAPADLVRAKEMLATPGFKAADVAAILKVSPRTLFRELRAARDREEVGV